MQVGRSDGVLRQVSLAYKCLWRVSARFIARFDYRSRISSVGWALDCRAVGRRFDSRGEGEALRDVTKNGCEADWGLVVQTLSNCCIHWIVYPVDSVIPLLNKLNLTNCDQNVSMCSELHYRRDWSLPCCFGFGDTRTPRLIAIRYLNNPRSSES